MDDVPRFDAVIGFYPVEDLAATRDFYERDLGLTLERDQERCLIFRAGRGYLGFCRAEHGAAGHEQLMLTLVCDDVDGVYRRLLHLGVETEGAPREDAALGLRHFFARDPDGYRVEVQRFARPLSRS